MWDFDEIYAEYYKEVYQFVLTLCRNRTLAEEITQETFFKALKKIDHFKGNCKMSTWLCTIAKNAYFDNSKKQNYPFEDTPSQENIEARFTDRETAYEIHKTLHKLSEPYKEVFHLRTFAELSFSQIAVLFGKTESWARVTYYRAKVLIKEELT